MNGRNLTAARITGAALAAVLCLSLTRAPEAAAQDVESRAKILGVAHLAVYVKDLEKSRRFYEDFLGFAEPFPLPPDKGTGARIAFVKVNDQQYFELFREPDRGEGQLHHIAFYTDHAQRLLAELKSKGAAGTASGGVTRDKTGNWNFTVRDPDGHDVEFVEYRRGSLTSRAAGKSMPSARISEHIMHVGVLVGDLDRAMAFYHGILGFGEFWRGSRSETELNWVNMRAPNGQDYLEFMLYSKLPAPGDRGTPHHASLTIANAEEALAALKARAARAGYTREITIITGINRKRHIDLYDPDGTRIELMEANTVDGKPAPSSQAPPPHPGSRW